MMPSEKLKLKRVLLVKFGHHGDILLATPLARMLKMNYPDVQIDMLLHLETADMVRDNPDIAHIWAIDRKWKKQGVGVQIKQESAIASGIHAQHYDAVIDISGNWRGAWITLFSGAPIRISYDYTEKPKWLWQLCHNRVVERGTVEMPMVEDNLQLLEPLGIRFDRSFNPVCMGVSEQTKTALEGKLREKGWQGEKYVVAHPGSRWFFKCWDNEKNAEILQRLLDNGHNIVLTASPDEREREMIDYLVQYLTVPPQAKLWVLSGCLNLRELAAAIRGAELFFGVDSVPMHMAAAFGIPQVALFGPSWVNRWRPYSDKAIVIWAGDYGNLPHPDSIDTSDQTRLLNAIPVDVVWQAILQQLPKSN